MEFRVVLVKKNITYLPFIHLLLEQATNTLKELPIVLTSCHEYKTDITDTLICLDHNTLNREETITILAMINTNIMATLRRRCKHFSEKMTQDERICRALRHYFTHANTDNKLAILDDALRLEKNIALYTKWLAKLRQKKYGSQTSLLNTLKKDRDYTNDTRAFFQKTIKQLDDLSLIRNLYEYINNQPIATPLITSLHTKKNALLQNIARQKNRRFNNAPQWHRSFVYFASFIKAHPAFILAQTSIIDAYDKMGQKLGKDIAATVFPTLAVILPYASITSIFLFIATPLLLIKHFQNIIIHALMQNINGLIWIGNQIENKKETLFRWLKKHTPKCLVPALNTIKHWIPQTDIISLLNKQHQITWCLQLLAKLLLNRQTSILATVFNHALYTYTSNLLQNALNASITNRTLYTWTSFAINILLDKIISHITTSFDETNITLQQCEKHARALKLTASDLNQKNIRQNYKKLSLKYHPDKSITDTTKQQTQLNLADEYFSLWDDRKPLINNCEQARQQPRTIR